MTPGPAGRGGVRRRPHGHHARLRRPVPAARERHGPVRRADGVGVGADRCRRSHGASATGPRSWRRSIVFAGRRAVDVNAAGAEFAGRRGPRRGCGTTPSPGCAGTSRPATTWCWCRRRSAPTSTRWRERLGADGVALHRARRRRRRRAHGGAGRAELPRRGEGATASRVARRASRRPGQRRAVGVRRLARRPRAARRRRPPRSSGTGAVA